MDSKIATPNKKEISPNEKTMTSTAAPEPVVPSKNLTYEAMIKQAFVETFNKVKKLRDQGVTYQTLWKEIETRHKEASKKMFLQRLKKSKVLIK